MALHGLFAALALLGPAAANPVNAPAGVAAAKPDAAAAQASRRPIAGSAIAVANRPRPQTPRRHHRPLVGGSLTLDYGADTTYRITAAPGRLTAIRLAVGEHLVSKASGDTRGWSVGDTREGDGAAERGVVLIRPSRSGLSTNIVLTTTRATYVIDTTSRNYGPYAALVRFNMPEPRRLEPPPTPQKPPLAAAVAAAVSAATEVPADPSRQGIAEIQAPRPRLNFGYEISHPSGPQRTIFDPIQVFDDGRQTFIDMPADPRTSAAPLFILGADGRAELVNYRIIGRSYVVDRLFDVAELRVGETRQTIIRIRRLGGGS